jgi:hypothetical protein
MADHTEAIAMFVGITGADEATALQMLTTTDFQLEQAINLFFAAEHQGPGQAFGGGAAAPALDDEELARQLQRWGRGAAGHTAAAAGAGEGSMPYTLAGALHGRPATPCSALQEYCCRFVVKAPPKPVLGSALRQLQGGRCWVCSMPYTLAGALHGRPATPCSALQGYCCRFVVKAPPKPVLGSALCQLQGGRCWACGGTGPCAHPRPHRAPVRRRPPPPANAHPQVGSSLRSATYSVCPCSSGTCDWWFVA